MTKVQQSYLEVGSWVEVKTEQPRVPHQIVAFENHYNRLRLRLDDGKIYGYDDLCSCTLNADWYNRIYDVLDNSIVNPIAAYDFVMRLTQSRNIRTVHQAQYEMNKMQIGLGNRI